MKRRRTMSKNMPKAQNQSCQRAEGSDMIYANKTSFKTRNNHYTYCNYLRETFFTKSHIFICAFSIIMIIFGLLFLSLQVQGSDESAYKYYKSVEIQAGDTLWSIAQTYMGDDYNSVQEYIMEVEKINGIRGETITAGNSLVVPYYSKDLH